MMNITITINKIIGSNIIKKFSLTNFAETLTIDDARLILFLKQQKATAITTANMIQSAPMIDDKILLD